jgi:glyoxylate utilization-related uncharacterized protein
MSKKPFKACEINSKSVDLHALIRISVVSLNKLKNKIQFTLIKSKFVVIKGYYFPSLFETNKIDVQISIVNDMISSL